jgi:molybdate transport system ATP-binding protein
MTLDISVRMPRGALHIEAEVSAPARGITCLIGRSGAGKSSVLLAACGLLRPAAGRILLDGDALFDSERGIDLPPHARRLGVVFQDGRLFPHRSVRGNLLFGARRAPARAAGPGFDEVVELLGLGALLSRPSHSLSGGERQRVALARALLMRPRALLMDEPLASLDPARRAELLHYFAALPHRLSIPILYVTHQMDEVMRLADRAVLMADGRVAAAGPALDLLSDLTLTPHLGRFEAGAVLAGQVSEQLGEWQLTVVSVAGQRVTVPAIPGAAVGASVRLRVRARDVAVQPAPQPSSASNQLAATVLRVIEREGEHDRPYAAVELALRGGAQAAAGERLWALVTRRSVQQLALVPGRACVATFKAVAVEGRAAAVIDEA